VQNHWSAAQEAIPYDILEALDEAIVVFNAAGESVRTNPAYDRLLEDADGEMNLRDEAGTPLTPWVTTVRSLSLVETTSCEAALCDRYGRQRFFRLSLRPISPPGPAGEVAFVVFHEQTDAHLRLLEEQFVARAAHELRTPLSSIRNYAELLLEHAASDELSSDVRMILRRLHGQSQRLSTTVEDLFDIARISTRKLSLAWQLVDLGELVVECVETARSLPNTVPIALHACDEQIMIRGDTHRLGSVVLNLLANAIRHASSTPRIDVRLRQDAEGVIVEVEDYGPGIAPDALPLIFMKYAQPSKADSTDTNRDGLGLGLFIAQEIVIAHGGRIEVTSKPGRGTRFKVRLPRT